MENSYRKNYKIAIITNSSGGFFCFREDLIKELIKRGNRILALTPFDGHEDDLKALGVELTEVIMDRRGINPIHDIALIKSYYVFLQKEKPDFVITYTIKPNIYGGLSSRIAGISYASNITGLGTAFEKPGVLRNFVTHMYKISLRQAKCVFFENSSDRDFFITEKIISIEQAVLLNGAGVNLDRFYYQPYPEEDRPFHFLYMGRVMKEKGVEELFTVMKRLKEENYDCVLDVLGGFEEDYKNAIDQYSKEGWLNYYGFQEDVRPFIAKCHCFVLPSYHEGMANTNLECAASGRAIVTSNIPGCREAVVNEISGLLCEPRMTESLYVAMRKILFLSLEALQKMGIEGRKHMENNFDKCKVVEETIRYLNQ